MSESDLPTTNAAASPEDELEASLHDAPEPLLDERQLPSPEVTAPTQSPRSTAARGESSSVPELSTGDAQIERALGLSIATPVSRAFFRELGTSLAREYSAHTKSASESTKTKRLPVPVSELLDLLAQFDADGVSERAAFAELIDLYVDQANFPALAVASVLACRAFARGIGRAIEPSTDPTTAPDLVSTSVEIARTLERARGMRALYSLFGRLSRMAKQLAARDAAELPSLSELMSRIAAHLKHDRAAPSVAAKRPLKPEPLRVAGHIEIIILR